MRNPSPYDCGIYSITSPSGNMYIGSSNNIPKRWNTHRRELNKQIHPNRILQSSWNKYEGNLEFTKLLICEEKDLQLYEQQYLDFYKPKYNISPTAYSNRGIKRTEAFKENLRKLMTGNTYMKGRKLSDETKEKLRISSTGNQYAKGGSGYVPTPEHREKLRKAGMGHFVSEETRKKIGEASKKMWEKKKALRNVI